MILTKKEIQKELKDGKIKITPYNPRNLGPASYDLTLDNTFWFFKPIEVKINEQIDVKDYTVVRKYDEILLLPGEFVLGRTKEKVRLPEDVSGFLSGRSRFARFGLAVHVTAFFINPGVDNRQIFEIKNTSNNPLRIPVGLKIAQLIFVKNQGKAKYKGRFAVQ